MFADFSVINDFLQQIIGYPIWRFVSIIFLFSLESEVTKDGDKENESVDKSKSFTEDKLKEVMILIIWHSLI